MKVLDHGYVDHIESWGRGRGGKAYDPAPDAERGTLEYAASATVARSDDYEVGIIEAARQSTQGAFRGWDLDSKLLAHLYGHNHETPFEFAGMVIEVQAPIFVFREWHRHRTQSYNEMSARYTPLPELYYQPDQQNVLRRAEAAVYEKNKQAGSIVHEVDANRINFWLDRNRRISQALEEHYIEGLKAGVPKELARVNMPVGHYSRMRASATLRNWLAFLTLRMDPLAQWEIRQFANTVGTIIADQFPRTWALFNPEGEFHE